MVIQMVALCIISLTAYSVKYSILGHNKQCTVDKPKCANCKGEHPSSSKTCPKKIEKLLSMKKNVSKALAIKKALGQYVVAWDSEKKQVKRIEAKDLPEYVNLPL
jgi:hypothetical protein